MHDEEFAKEAKKFITANTKALPDLDLTDEYEFVHLTWPAEGSPKISISQRFGLDRVDRKQLERALEDVIARMTEQREESGVAAAQAFATILNEQITHRMKESSEALNTRVEKLSQEVASRRAAIEARRQRRTR